MKKNSKNLKVLGIIIICFSAWSILVRLFPISDVAPNILFWTYMIVSAANLYAGYLLITNAKNAARYAVWIIAITFVLLEVAWAVLNRDFVFDYTLMSAIIPGFLIYFLIKNQQPAKK